MRRMTATRINEDRGAVAVVVALLMVVIIGFAAVSVDVGANFALKRELQNGADAAVLAVAQQSECQPPADPSGGTALKLAQQNVFSSQVRTEGRSLGPSQVTVDVFATNEDGSVDGRPNLFAPILANDGSLNRTDVRASATAGCGKPLSGNTALPMTFNECLFADPGSATVKLIRSDQNAPDCSGETDDNRPSGGFGVLQGDACAVEVNAEVNDVQGVPGNVFPKSCEDEAEGLRNATVLIPIYDDFTGGGNDSFYHVVGFAAFKILGYRFSGLSWNNTGPPPWPSCTGNCRGIIGTFVERVTLAEGAGVGGQDFGVTAVRLTA